MEWWEPDDGRLSCPFLREPVGEVPMGHSPCGNIPILQGCETIYVRYESTVTKIQS
jgi:hypothetical protein